MSSREAAAELRAALAWLERHASKRTRDGMARYGIPSDHSLGVSVADIRVLARSLGRNHDLAASLWGTGVYEARMLACFVAEPARVKPAEMDRWARDFDCWAICDTACFHLFDRTPHAWRKIEVWCRREREFVRRAGFALLASLALHDKAAADAPFVESLALVEQGASDERNLVKKAVSWALRGIGRRNGALRASATSLATRLAASSEPAARWVGKDALRDLARPARRLGKEGGGA